MEKDEVKTFRTWLVLDYRNGKFRTVKRLAKTMKPTEIAIDLTLDVSIPKSVTIKAHGKIELSTTKVNEMILEELEA